MQAEGTLFASHCVSLWPRGRPEGDAGTSPVVEHAPGLGSGGLKGKIWCELEFCGPATASCQGGEHIGRDKVHELSVPGAVLVEALISYQLNIPS